MKAQIVDDIVHDGPVFGAGRLGRVVKRVFFPEVKVAVSFADGQLQVIGDFAIKEADAQGMGGCSVASEIDCPDEFAQAAVSFVKSRDVLL